MDPVGVCAWTTMPGTGTVMTGGVWFFTLIVKCASPFVPTWVVAEQSTSVGPMGKVDPEAGTHVTGKATPSNGSFAVGGVYVMTAPAGLVASTSRAGGTL